ncbi:MAG TPA: acyltransferase family protein [Gaiellaceae bacterium]|nr:acyltransferase family protein [Gaiellaceae bacterium]
MATKRHRDDLQGLRAVAVLLVVFAHAGIGPLRGGFVGVDVFFVLSGFLITGLLLSEALETGFVSLTNFYVRRARRILPAAGLTLVVTLIASCYLLNVVRAKQVIQDTLWAAVCGANVHFAHLETDYFSRTQAPSPVLHFWSLSIEEQFYLVWPGLLALVVLWLMFRERSHRRRIAFAHRSVPGLFIVILGITVASLVWSVRYTTQSPTASYFSTFSRIWELGLGATLATISAFAARMQQPLRVVVGWLGLAAVLLAAVLYSSRTSFPGYAALLPTVGAAMLIAAGTGRERSWLEVGRWLSVLPMRFIGDRSYTLYLWHWPVLIIAAGYLGYTPSAGVNLLLVAGAFVISIVTFQLFENPIRRADWPAARSLALWPIAVCAVVIIGGFLSDSIDKKTLAAENALIALESSKVPTGPQTQSPKTFDVSAPTDRTATASSLPDVVAAVKAVRRRAPIPTVLDPPVTELANGFYYFPAGCMAGDGQAKTRLCRIGDVASQKLMIAMGDSHLQMWMWPIEQVATEDKYAIVPLAKSGCSPSSWHNPLSNDCGAWYQWALRQIKALHPDVLLLSTAYRNASEDNLVQFINYASAHARRVVVLQDTQVQNSDPSDCLLGRNATMARCSATMTHTDLDLDLEALSKLNGFGFLQTEGWFCYETVCPMVIGNKIAYRDGSHVSATYSQDLATLFHAAFQQALGAKHA